MNLIIATSENYAIGFQNKMLWHLRDELINFRKKTINKVLIMGRNTYESLPEDFFLSGNRKIIVASKKQPNSIVSRNLIFTQNPLEFVSNYDKKEDICIVGGSLIYALFEPYVNKVFWTKVRTHIQTADTYYKPDISKFELVSAIHFEKDVSNNHSFDMETWVRK
jgi:dihydrofolate reductase